MAAAGMSALWLLKWRIIDNGAAIKHNDYNSRFTCIFSRSVNLGSSTVGYIGCYWIEDYMVLGIG